MEIKQDIKNNLFKRQELIFEVEEFFQVTEFEMFKAQY